MVNDKEDKVINNSDEIVVPFCRLFVLFKYATNCSTTCSKDELKAFVDLFSAVSIKVVGEDLTFAIKKENLLNESLKYFNNNKAYKCYTIKNEYIDLLTMVERDKKFIDIRNKMFEVYYQHFCTQDSLDKMKVDFQIMNDVMSNNNQDDIYEEDETNLVQ